VPQYGKIQRNIGLELSVSIYVLFVMIPKLRTIYNKNNNKQSPSAQ